VEDLLYCQRTIFKLSVEKLKDLFEAILSSEVIDKIWEELEFGKS
jgi:hypothetical protein